MNALYPIIRRVRRPLFPPEDEKKAATPVAVEAAQAALSSADGPLADGAPASAQASEPVEAPLLALTEAPAAEPKKAKGKSRANANA